MDETARIHLDVLREAVLLRAGRQQDLEELAVADGHDHVQVRDVIQRVAAVVDFVVHVERFGEVRRFHERRDPALHGHVAAQVIGGLVHEPRRVRRESAGRVLRREDRDREVLLELDVAQQIVVGQRILVPVEAELLGDLSHA